MVRSTVVLPHGLGKTKRVAVITTGDRLRDAEAAGADFFGGEELVAIFHSHTHSPAVPSATDRRAAMYPDQFYVIATLAARYPWISA